MELASCWGFEFDPKLIASASGADIQSALRRCTRIEREYRLLRQLETTYVFDHHQIQEVLYERLFPPLRAQYHGALADALEHRERVNPAAGDGGQVAVQLCNHFFAGGQDERALGYLDAALDHLAASNARESGTKLAERALSAAGLLTGERRIGVLLRLAGDLDMIARISEARPALEEALKLSQLAGNRALEAKVYRQLGINTSRGGRIADEVIEFERALALSREAGDVKEEILAAGNLALALRVLGRYQESKSTSESMLELARRTGDRNGETVALGALGAVLMGLGEPERALEAHSQALVIAQSLGDKSAELRSTWELGTTLWNLHRNQEARELLDRVVIEAHGIGNRIVETFALIRIGDVSLDGGNYEEARDGFQRVLSLVESSGRRAEQ
ncbi:MAG TPA: tetratricopeptide repeat protein, partial [Vicinamibacteria bacterium]